MSDWVYLNGHMAYEKKDQTKRVRLHPEEIEYLVEAIRQKVEQDTIYDLDEAKTPVHLLEKLERTYG